MFGQYAVLPIELENIKWNTGNWIEAINDTALLRTARPRQLE
jgi:hypothetical protein